MTTEFDIHVRLLGEDGSRTRYEVSIPGINTAEEFLNFDTALQCLPGMLKEMEGQPGILAEITAEYKIYEMIGDLIDKERYEDAQIAIDMARDVSGESPELVRLNSYCSVEQFWAEDAKNFPPLSSVATRLSPPEGDWEAIYFGDKLIDQGHSVQWYKLMEAAGFEVHSHEIPAPDGEYPDSLKEALKGLEEQNDN